VRCCLGINLAELWGGRRDPGPAAVPRAWRAHGNRPPAPTAAPVPAPGSRPGAGAGARLLQRAGIVRPNVPVQHPTPSGNWCNANNSSLTHAAPCLRWDSPTLLRNPKINQALHTSPSWVRAAAKPQPQTSHPLPAAWQRRPQSPQEHGRGQAAALQRCDKVPDLLQPQLSSLAATHRAVLEIPCQPRSHSSSARARVQEAEGEGSSVGCLQQLSLPAGAAPSPHTLPTREAGAAESFPPGQHTMQILLPSCSTRRCIDSKPFVQHRARGRLAGSGGLGAAGGLSRVLLPQPPQQGETETARKRFCGPAQLGKRNLPAGERWPRGAQGPQGTEAGR